MHKSRLSPTATAWLTDTFARNRAMFGGFRMEAAGDPDPNPTDPNPQTFNQADVDRIVNERLKREREATRTKYADYEDLKAKAEGAKTAEERMAELEKEISATKHEALKRRVQAAHKISDEDADLFLTGTDEESLTAQAKRLEDRDAERKKSGNHVPREGDNPKPGEDGLRTFARDLFKSGD